jgi:hypothetical protein
MVFRLVAVGDLFDERGRINRRKQSAALEVVGDDAGDADPDFAVGRRTRHEIRDRDRQRRDIAFGDLQLGLGVGRRRQQQACGQAGATEQKLTAIEREWRQRKRLYGHSRGLIFKKRQL